MGRVLGELFRQTRWVWLMLLVVFTTGEVVMLRRADPANAGMLLNYGSLGVDLMCLLIMTTSMDPLRMLRWVFIVPVRRRDFGASLWFMNVIGPVVLTSTTKLLVIGLAWAFLPDAPVSLRWVVSSGLVDFAYVGSLCWLMLHTIQSDYATGVHPWLTKVYGTLETLLVIGGTVALGWQMPTTSSMWNWPIGLALLAMLSLTATGYLQSERLAVYGGPLQLLVGKRRTDSGRGMAPAVAPFKGRLNTPRRMLWEQFRSAAIVSVTMIGLLVFMANPPLLKTLEQVRRDASTIPAELGGALWLLGAAAYLAIGIKRWQPARILLLRTLPISAHEISLLLLLRPVVTGLAFWLALLPIYCLSPAGMSQWMGLGSLAGLIGFTGLTSAAMLRWHRSPLVSSGLLFLTQLLLLTHPWKYIEPIGWGPGTVQLVCLAVGICGTVAAYRWNDRLLTRSGALYQRMK